MIYDIILGKTLPTKYNYNYIDPILFDRIDREEITDYLGLVEVISNALTGSLANAMQISDTIENVSIELNNLKDLLEKGETVEDVDTKVRELLSTLAYIGIDIYLIRRSDLSTAQMDNSTATRAYMIDKHDTYFPKLNRVVNGKSLVFDDQKEAAISTVVMQFLKDFAFEDVVEDALNLERYRSMYEKMEEAHMGWSLDTDQLIRFFDEYGYKFVVVL